MRGSRKTLHLAAAIVCVAAAVAFAGDEDVGARHWNMACGGPDRTSRVTCEPIRRQPVEAWTVAPDGGLLCDPVVWDGTVFVVSRDEEKRNVLLAYDARTGEEKAQKILLQSTADLVSLVVWQGTVVMTEPDIIRGFLFKGDSFKPMWKKKGQFWRDPGICRDILLVYDGGNYELYDLRRGRKIDLSISGGGLASVAFRDAKTAIVATVDKGDHSGYEGTWLRPRFYAISALGKRTPERSYARGDDRPVAMFDESREIRIGRAVIARMDAAEPRGPGGWLVWSKTGFQGKSDTFRGIVVPDADSPGLVDARVTPAIYAGNAYTFDKDWDLLSVDVNGRYRTVVESGDQPASAWRGRPSIAQNVAYFGNWAVDLDTRRVLWVHKFKEDIDLPAIPAGDGLVVVQTDSGKLIGLADPDVAAQAEGASAAEDQLPPAQPLPSARSGLVLRDGSEVLGTVAKKGDTYRVIPPKGDPVTVPTGDVLIAFNRDGLVHAASDGDIYATLRRAARATVVRGMEDLFDQALRMEIPNAAGSMLEKAREWGMTEARAKELSRQLTGKRMHPNADIRRAALIKRTEAAKTDAADEIVACAAWCEARGLPNVAAGVLEIAQRLDDQHDGIEDLAVKTVPEAFPWRDSKRAWQMWLRWAAQMLPADARFLADDDPAWKRGTGGWTRAKGAFGFRTPHLLLFSRSEDVEAVGPCLRYGEAAIGGLEMLLEEGKAQPVDGDDDRLDVRIHRNREEYLKERTSSGGAPTWSLGYYAPWENVSRFFVPSAGENREALGRGLFKVLAHELTHHYVDARWVPRRSRKTRRSSRAPGFWIVEGLARFVEDQIVDADVRGLTFDDYTVESIDAAAQLAKGGHAFTLESFVDLSQNDFGRLNGKTVAKVTLRRSLVSFDMDPRSIFYEQAGALTFYMLRERGESGRRKLIDYLLAHYTATTRPEGWRALGFASARSMETGFRSFLRKVR